MLGLVPHLVRLLVGLSLTLSCILHAQGLPSAGAAESLIEQERFAEAEQMLEGLTRQAPGETQLMFRLGYVQFRQRKLTAARKQFLAIVTAAPPAHNSRYFLGRIALLENRPVEAIRWLEPVVAARETIYDAAAQLAAAYQTAGQPQRSLEPLRLALQQAPWDGGLYYRLGRAYQQLGQAELARDAFTQTERLKRANADDVGILMEASRLAETGKMTEATSLARRLTTRAEVDPAALVALGLVWARSGWQAEALAAFERAAARDDKYFAAQFNFGLALLRLGRSIDAYSPLERAVRLLPQSLDANLTLGLAAVMNQRYREARPALETARRLDPANRKVAMLLATTCLRTGAAAEAIQILRTSGAAAGEDVSGPLLLVEALQANRENEAALEVAQAAGRRFPSSLPAQMAWAQQLARAGRYQEARPVFERILQLVPGQPEATLGLADALQKAGEHDPALERYRAAIAYPTTSLPARLGAARSLVSLRRLPEARQTLEAGLPGHATDPALRLELSRVYTRLGLTEDAAREVQMVNQLKAAERKP